jgi:hypothetical protein
LGERLTTPYRKKSGCYEMLHKASDFDIRPRQRKMDVGKPEGKRPLGRPRRRWEDIRMNLKEVVCGSVDWIHLAQDRIL